VFFILCDGTTDTAVKEQMSIVLPFVKNEESHEVFVGFEELEGTTGEAIATDVLNSLSSYGLDLHKMRSQGYDGCVAMKAHMNGVLALVTK